MEIETVTNCLMSLFSNSRNVNIAANNGSGNSIQGSNTSQIDVNQCTINIATINGSHNSIQDSNTSQTGANYGTIHNTFNTSNSKEPANKNRSIRFDLREPVKNFTGREKALELLHKNLSRNERVVISQTASISGLGGIGKSELARKYANEYKKSYDDNVIWINADKQEDMKNSFLRLASEELKIPINEKKDGKEQERDIKSIVKDVYAYFGNVESLFIFDNAEDFKSIYDFLPFKFKLNSNDNKPHVLITSRNQKWKVEEEGKIELLELGEFSSDEAARFIKEALKDININLEEIEIEQLARTMQYFPLALRQAVSYILRENENFQIFGDEEFKIANYLEEYKKKAKALLNFPKFDTDEERYAKTTFITWKVTIDNIEQKKYGQEALNILNIMAYLAPDELHIEKLFSNSLDKDKLKGAFKLLDQYSMISLKKGVSKIHRLVQQVIRIWLQEQNEEEKILSQALELLNINSKEENLFHVINIFEYISKYVNLIDKYLQSNFNLNDETLFRLLDSSGFYNAIKDKLTYSGNIYINNLPSNYFTGRENELKVLQNKLQNYQMTSISGLGGIGKSELAMKYANDYKKAYDENVVWINAETQESLKNSFYKSFYRITIQSIKYFFDRLATEELRIPVNEDKKEQERDLRSIVYDVYRYFQNGKSLFIFDNTEELKSIKEFLPVNFNLKPNKPYVLVTSRNRKWEVVMDLDVFPTEQAANFIRYALEFMKNDLLDSDIKKLAEKVEFYPLALRQATSYIREKNQTSEICEVEKFKISDYLKEYEKNAESLLNFNVAGPYSKTTIITWIVTIEDIKKSSRDALNILYIMAYIAHDQIHIEKLFSNLVKDKANLSKAVELLHQFSMIKLDKEVSSINRFVQQVIRIWLRKQSEEEKILDQALKLVKDGISEIDIHVMTIWEHANKYGNLIEKYLYSEYKLYSETMVCFLARNGRAKTIEDILMYFEIKNGRGFKPYNQISEFLDNLNKYSQILLHAAESDNLTLLKYVLEKGTDFNVQLKLQTIRVIAFKQGDLHVAEYIDKIGADLNYMNVIFLPSLKSVFSALAIGIVSLIICDRLGYNALESLNLITLVSAAPVIFWTWYDFPQKYHPDNFNSLYSRLRFLNELSRNLL